ncbi:MAG: trigger factor [Gammaproteobacteria bacterium]|nr:trigger factor [Gammaproteobacteria bacterium]
MQVSVESAGGLQRKLTIAVPEDTIEQAVQTRLQNLTRTAKIKGFRAGKVPLKVVKQHYGTQVRQEVVGEVIQSSFYEAVSQEKLRPASSPSIDAQKINDGEGLEYTATFEVYPEIELADISGAKIEKLIADISDADLDEMIDTIRKQQVQWDVVDKNAESGDQVVIDFKGKIDGEEFAGGSGENMTVEIGAGRMIKGFEDGLLGLKVDDEKTLDLAFPEEYHAKEIAGKDVQFDIKVKEVKASSLPPVDEEFAKKLGVADGNIEKMREDVKGNMQRELDARLQNSVKQAVMDQLLELNKIDIPSSLIEQESEVLLRQMQNNLMQQGMQQNQLAMEPSMFKDQAERRVALGLIMSEIVKQQNMKADADKVRAFIDEMASSYEKPDEVVKWYYNDKQRMAEVESMVIEQQIVDWVLEQAKVEDKTETFNKIMYPEKD